MGATNRSLRELMICPSFEPQLSHFVTEVARLGIVLSQLELACLLTLYGEEPTIVSIMNIEGPASALCAQARTAAAPKRGEGREAVRGKRSFFGSSLPARDW